MPLGSDQKRVAWSINNAINEAGNLLGSQLTVESASVFSSVGTPVSYKNVVPPPRINPSPRSTFSRAQKGERQVVLTLAGPMFVGAERLVHVLDLDVIGAQQASCIGLRRQFSHDAEAGAR
jgi:hypothetical protein